MTYTDTEENRPWPKQPQPEVQPEVSPVLPNTAVIRINPDSDEAFLALRSGAERLLIWAQARTVANDNDLKGAADDLNILAGYRKRLKEKQIEWTSPIREHLDEVAGAFKAISGPLDQADTITKDKIGAYRQILKDRAAAAEKANALRLQASQLEAAANAGVIKEPVVVNPVPPMPAKTLRTDVGTLSAREDWDYEIVDASLLPREYMKPDLVKLRHDVVTNKGKLVIPGIRQYQKESFRTTPRRAG